MGMLACYMEADKGLLADFFTKSPEERFDTIEELEGEGRQPVLDLDKLWDGLHCLLTGRSASEPIEGDLLSEAVVGTDFFSEEDAEFIAYILPERLKQIVAALADFDIEAALNRFEPADFNRKKIYPNIWIQDMQESLREELKAYYKELVLFYKQTADRHNGIIVSIY